MEVDILDLLRDPAAAAVLAGLAVLAPLLVALAQRKTKALAYHYECTPVLSVDEDVTSHVRVFFNEQEVSTVHVVRIKIVNVGHLPIIGTDYEKPIVLRPTTASAVLSAEVTDVHPSDLEVHLKLKRATDSSIERIEIHPLLLHRADGLQLRCLVSGQSPKLAVSGRIAGVKDFDWFDLDTEVMSQRLARGALWALFGVGAVTLGGVLTVVPRIIGTIVILVVGLFVATWLSFKLTAAFDPWRRFR